jgi:Leucine-rich repeat (LRR) protein
MLQRSDDRHWPSFVADNWLPEELGSLPQTLCELALPGCQISVLPDSISQLSQLTALVLDRNFIRQLPASLAALSCLQLLRYVVLGGVGGLKGTSPCRAGCRRVTCVGCLQSMMTVAVKVFLHILVPTSLQSGGLFLVA